MLFSAGSDGAGRPGPGSNGTSYDAAPRQELNRGIEFIIAVNEFDSAFRYEPGEVRAAVGLSPRVPVARCDARDPHSATAVLVELVRHLVAISPALSPGG